MLSIARHGLKAWEGHGLLFGSQIRDLAQIERVLVSDGMNWGGGGSIGYWRDIMHEIVGEGSGDWAAEGGVDGIDPDGMELVLGG